MWSTLKTVATWVGMVTLVAIASFCNPALGVMVTDELCGDED